MDQVCEEEKDTKDKCQLISCDGSNNLFEKKLLAKVSSILEAIFKSLVGHDTSSLLIPTLTRDGLYSLHQLIYKGHSYVAVNQVEKIKSQLEELHINVTSQVSSSFKDSAGQCSSLGKELNNRSVDCADESYSKDRVTSKASANQLIKKHDEYAILRFCYDQENIDQQSKVSKANYSRDLETENSNGINKSSSPSLLLTSPLGIDASQVKTQVKEEKDDKDNGPTIKQAGTWVKMEKEEPKAISNDSHPMQQLKEANSPINEATQANVANGEIERITQCIRKNLPDWKYFRGEDSGLTCFICCKSLSNPQTWTQHLMGQLFHQIFQCPSCPKKYKYLTSFNLHIKSDHGQSISS